MSIIMEALVTPFSPVGWKFAELYAKDIVSNTRASLLKKKNISRHNFSGHQLTGLPGLDDPSSC
jgi:hypothetical protein